MIQRGNFVVFEGIDGCGKTTQIGSLANRVRALDKYQDVLLTREPTWRASEIRAALETQTEPYSGGDALARQFIEDRAEHWRTQIDPALERGVVVLCDRYALSTCAYQSTQGVVLDELLEGHRRRGIGVPRLTLYVDVPVEVAAARMSGRVEKEKFEGNERFNRELRKTYLELAEESTRPGKVRDVLGEIFVIDGTKSINEVEAEIWVAYSQRIRPNTIRA